MDVKLDVRQTFIIDGKEYASPAEMPDDVRRTCEKAMARPAGPRDSESRMAFKTKIVLNGVEYEGVDSMPGEVRKLCELAASACGRRLTHRQVTRFRPRHLDDRGTALYRPS